MRAVLDTNVIISGIFFGGVPRAILEAWEEGSFELILSPEIFDEYLNTCEELGTSRPSLRFREILLRLERRRDMLISTLRDVVEAMGGELHLVAEFPDGPVEIRQFDGEDAA